VTLRLAVVATIVGVLAGGAATGGDPCRGPLWRCRSGVPCRFSSAACPHVVFFATWCPPCVAELPRLTELEARYGESGYELAVVRRLRAPFLDRLAAFWESHNVSGRLLFDADGALERAPDGGRPPYTLGIRRRRGRSLASGLGTRRRREAVEQRRSRAD